MASMDPEEFPNLEVILGQLLARVAPAQAPLLIAIAERLAAARYRAWAEECADAKRKGDFLACADREETIAARVEALFPDAATTQAEIRRANPDIEEINRGIFAGRPLLQQLAIQARAERLGAATWKAVAAQAPAAARAVFVACADLEEESARVLDAVLASDGGTRDEPRRR